MKKLLLSAIAICAFSIVSFAQMSIGAKAGFNFANVGGDAENTDMRTSIHLGGYLNFAMSEQLSIQPELLYNSVGAKVSEGDFEATTKLNYLSIPVMVKYSFGNINVQAGPQLGLLLGAKEKWEGDGESGEDDVKEFYNGTDFGFNFGLGAEFGKLNATLRYSAGLSNIVDTDEDVKVTNNVIQLSIGYTLFGGDD
ncbi:MAG TPA: porin family protein [Chryseosolibacter sp.]|nr:porin family protein [Chryseosolibacter sp.]